MGDTPAPELVHRKGSSTGGPVAEFTKAGARLNDQSRPSTAECTVEVHGYSFGPELLGFAKCVCVCVSVPATSTSLYSFFFLTAGVRFQ